MSPDGRTLEIRSSPHVLAGYDVGVIMNNVVLALLPTVAFAVAAFGLAALVTIVGAVLSCLATEWAACRLAGREPTLADGSVLITGLLYGLTLPPACPLWIVLLGGVVGVGLGKSIFGGLGRNPFNPALVGRAFLQAAFPVAMTTFGPAFSAGRFESLPVSTLTLPFARPTFDAWSGATPLSAWKFGGRLAGADDLAFGLVGGSTGETCALLIAAGGVYLIARNMMSWRIPAAMLGTVGLGSALLHALSPGTCPPAVFMLLSGGLMLGATFMATDMVGSPMTHAGCWLYGALIGALVLVIRVWGAMPEGVMYAILLGNAAAPLIDRGIQPRVFGSARSQS
ncbi:MAG: RnfABCDGE type electron transport complex subunit D [Myxococcota bacterium]